MTKKQLGLSVMKKFNNSFDIVGKKNYGIDLKRSLKSAFKNSKFYKNKLKKYKDIKLNAKEFEKIPFTTKRIIK